MPSPTPAPPLVNAPAAVPSLRTLGSTAVDAAAGDDSRLTTPTGAVTIAAAGKIPLADGAGKIDTAWLSTTGNFANVAGQLDLSEPGVTAATYTLRAQRATVDSHGRITGVAANGLAGDGIVDETTRMAAAVTFALNGGAQGELVLEPGTYKFATDCVVPNTISIRALAGAKMTIAAGVKLTIPKFEAGLHQCFDVNATPVVTHGSAGGGDATVSPTPLVELTVKCTTGGALGTAEFAFSVNGGAYSAPVASVGPGPWTYMIPNVQSEVTLTAGNYVLDEIVYSIKHAALYLTGTDTIYPEWFGASTSATDNSAALQAAFNCLSRPTQVYGSWFSGPGTMLFQTGEYRFRTPININRLLGGRIVGKGMMQTYLSYTATGAVTPNYCINFYNCRQTTVEDIVFRNQSAFPPTYVVRLESDNRTAGGVCSTAHRWTGVSVDAGKYLGAGCDVGLGFVYTSGSANANHDQSTFTKCLFTQAVLDGFRIGEAAMYNSNMKLFELQHCVVSYNATGVHVTKQGSIYADGGYWAHNDVDFAFDYPVDTATIKNIRSEQSGRLLTTGDPFPLGCNMPMPLIVEGCQYSPFVVNPDGYAVITRHPGPIEFRANLLSTVGDVGVFKAMHVVAPHTPMAPGAGIIIYEGNMFGGETADVTTLIETSGGGTPILIERNNIYNHANGGGVSPTQYSRSLTRMAGIRGISSDAVVQANNLCGSFNLTDANSDVPVAFPRNEPDTNYKLSITPSVFDSDAPLGSNRVVKITKAVDGFTVYFEAAPGAGNTNSFDWILVR